MTFVNITEGSEVLEFASRLMDQRGWLTTGLSDWDSAHPETGGKGTPLWHYVVIGGASNAGKTQLMKYLVRQAADQCLSPGIITMEVPKHGLQRMLYADLTTFGYYDFVHEKWMVDAPAKAKRLVSEMNAYRTAPDDGSTERERRIFVWENPIAPTISEIMAVCHQMVEFGSKVLFLDHLQLIKASLDQIVDRATEISERLRVFAHTHDVLVIALSQLHRTASRNREAPPTMHDLWGGNPIEANANQVLLVDHSRQSRDMVHPHLLRSWLVLDKNRDGPNKIHIPVELNFKSGVWRQAEPDEINVWPGGDK